jgi:hypothetical protein
LAVLEGTVVTCSALLVPAKCEKLPFLICPDLPRRGGHSALRNLAVVFGLDLPRRVLSLTTPSRPLNYAPYNGVKQLRKDAARKLVFAEPVLALSA